MSAPLTRFEIRLAVKNAVKEAVLSLDRAAYDRFKAACEFAKAMISRSLHRLEGQPAYLVCHVGMLLSIRFDRRLEKFLIVGVEDRGDGPEPPNGGRDILLYKLAGVVGFDLDPAIASEVMVVPRPERGWTILSTLEAGGVDASDDADVTDNINVVIDAAGVTAAFVRSCVAMGFGGFDEALAFEAKFHAAKGLRVSADQVTVLSVTRLHCAGDDELVVVRPPDRSSDP